MTVPGRPDPGPYAVPAAGTGAAAGGFRPDIEGLRALAVVLVILDHLGAPPHGGFIGVDVFFVISGFLITGLLVKEAAATGRISSLAFYRRRARRILPAASTVLLLTWFVAPAAFRGSRVAQVHGDIRWSLAFAANVHFAHLGTDYFQAGRAVSPVQHYWSLAVEEQFYLVWPVVLLLVVTVLRRRPAAVRTVALTVVVAVIGVSFGWALQQSTANPTGAYFSTFARAWELGVGALLAILAAADPSPAARIGALRGPLLAAGTGAIVAAAFWVHPGSGFPAPGAVLPVAGAAAVIVGGEGLGDSAWSAVLTNPVSRYVGRISFSLYLWHYPVIVFADAFVPHRDAAWYLMVVSAMVGGAVLCHQFVETPFRSPGHRPARHAARGRTVAGPGGRRAVTALAGCMGLLLALCFYGLRPPPSRPSAGLVRTAVVTGRVPGDVGAVPSAALTRSIDVALRATSFPRFDPPFSTLGLYSAELEWVGCDTGEELLQTCVFHDPTLPSDPAKVAVVIGDSISLSWLPTVEAALVSRGWTVYGLARQQCPATDVPTTTIGDRRFSGSVACSLHQAFVLRETRLLRPRLVFLSSTQAVTERFASGATGTAAWAEYEQGMERTDRAVAAPGREVVTLSPPPTAGSLPSCDTAGSVPLDCVSRVDAAWRAQSTADRRAAGATGTRYLDTEQWFCSEADACPAFVGDTPVYWDGTHLTDRYARSMGAQLTAGLSQLGQWPVR